ncbi:hypothetical protein Adt_27249 [Abeliophyllum distichum]|uniref:Uncharacterized protein n=1 Tax=Abeliophyllum distichum TaxID=126358 RepID=A0ABD1RTC7_9LAMI
MVKVRHSARKSTGLPPHLRPKALALRAYENFDSYMPMPQLIEKFLQLWQNATRHGNRISNIEAIDHLLRTFTPSGVEMGNFIKNEMLKEDPNHIDVETYCYTPIHCHEDYVNRKFSSNEEDSDTELETSVNQPTPIGKKIQIRRHLLNFHYVILIQTFLESTF